MGSTTTSEKHLELLQGVINRLSNNSFLLKGWSVTLVAGLMSLAAKGTERRFAIVAYLPIVAFWLLDAYYLRQERLFRALYDAVSAQGNTVPAFTMDTSLVSGSVTGWLRTCLAPVLLSLYGALLFVTILGGRLLP